MQFALVFVARFLASYFSGTTRPLTLSRNASQVHSRNLSKIYAKNKRAEPNSNDHSVILNAALPPDAPKRAVETWPPGNTLPSRSFRIPRLLPKHLKLTDARFPTQASEPDIPARDVKAMHGLVSPAIPVFRHQSPRCTFCPDL